MSNFDKSLDLVLKHEGGYVNDPRDPGGETNYGITKATARAAGYKGSMRDIPMSEVRRIYKRNYWDRIRADEMPPKSAFQVFDAAVNHGPKRAVQMAQQAAKMHQPDWDGLIGPKTLAAINAVPEDEFVMRFNRVRLDFYASLKTFGTFGRGWTRRVAGNLEVAAL